VRHDDCTTPTERGAVAPLARKRVAILKMMKVRALSIVVPLGVLVLGCSGPDGVSQDTGENSENTGDVAQAQAINPVGNGPRKHVLTG